DRLVHVDAAMAARLVVTKPVRLSRYLEEAGIENRLRRGAFAQRKRVEREERLDRRPRRIRAAQRSVEQRLVDRFVQLLPVGWIDTVDEKVRIVAGLRHEREHVTGPRVDRDQRSAPIAERRLGDFLQSNIE